VPPAAFSSNLATGRSGGVSPPEFFTPSRVTVRHRFTGPWLRHLAASGFKERSSLFIFSVSVFQRLPQTGGLAAP
jgi:hypothetical protein